MKNKVLIFALATLMLLSLCACGKNSNNILVGEYFNAGGDKLNIYENGSCGYYDAAWIRTVTGTWEIKDNKIIFHNILVNSNSDVYADISDFSNSFKLYLKEVDNDSGITALTKRQ